MPSGPRTLAVVAVALAALGTGAGAGYAMLAARSADAAKRDREVMREYHLTVARATKQELLQAVRDYRLAQEGIRAASQVLAFSPRDPKMKAALGEFWARSERAEAAMKEAGAAYLEVCGKCGSILDCEKDRKASETPASASHPDFVPCP